MRRAPCGTTKPVVVRTGVVGAAKRSAGAIKCSWVIGAPGHPQQVPERWTWMAAGEIDTSQSSPPSPSTSGLSTSVQIRSISGTNSWAIASGRYAVSDALSTKVADAVAVACLRGAGFDIVPLPPSSGRNATAMRFRLRYLQHDFEMGEGEFLIGRSPSCQLSLDDPLVSRRHALLIVTATEVSTEDLGSRNGVLVNGQRIVGRHPLTIGDRILIGAQEMTLLESKSEEQNGLTSTARLARLSITKMPNETASSGSTASHFVTAPPAISSNPREDTLQAPRRPVGGLSVIASVAEKSLSMNRVDEAERIVSASLQDVLEQLRSGQHVGSEVIDLAARLAARLASGTGKGNWVDFVVELYFREGRPCPAPVIDELYIALRKVNAVQTQQLRDYVARLRERVNSFGPAERFLFQRLEGLERLAGLRG